MYASQRQISAFCMQKVDKVFLFYSKYILYQEILNNEEIFKFIRTLRKMFGQLCGSHGVMGYAARQ